MNLALAHYCESRVLVPAVPGATRFVRSARPECSGAASDIRESQSAAKTSHDTLSSAVGLSRDILSQYATNARYGWCTSLTCGIRGFDCLKTDILINGSPDEVIKL